MLHGHTILIHSNAIVTVPAIQANVPLRPGEATSPAVTPLGNVPLVLVIAPSKRIKTIKELVAKAKVKPGELNYAAAGIGTPPHLPWTLPSRRRLRGATGAVQGAPEALTEVMTGRVECISAISRRRCR